MVSYVDGGALPPLGTEGLQAPYGVWPQRSQGMRAPWPYVRCDEASRTCSVHVMFMLLGALRAPSKRAWVWGLGAHANSNDAQVNAFLRCHHPR